MLCNVIFIISIPCSDSPIFMLKYKYNKTFTNIARTLLTTFKHNLNVFELCLKVVGIIKPTSHAMRYRIKVLKYCTRRLQPKVVAKFQKTCASVIITPSSNTIFYRNIAGFVFLFRCFCLKSTEFKWSSFLR